MVKRPEIRSYDYVNQPYARVRDAVTGDAVEVFRSATRAAADRARSVAAELRVDIAGIEIGKEIDIAVTDVAESKGDSGGTPLTRMRLAWKAATRPGLFPFMDAVLSIYPLTTTETQLDFSGQYEPPLGLLGGALDAVAGRRIAEASVHRFVADVAGHLRQSLGGAADH
jgi:hypothetical protein